VKGTFHLPLNAGMANLFHWSPVGEIGTSGSGRSFYPFSGPIHCACLC